MKIDHIDVINLRYEYPAERRFAYAGGTCTGRLSSLIPPSAPYEERQHD